MVVRIRLARWGRRNRPFYRIVAADSRSRRDGRFIEILGGYNPLPGSEIEAKRNIKRVLLNVERIKYWLSVGAQPSDTVSRLLGTAGLLSFHARSADPGRCRKNVPPVSLDTNASGAVEQSQHVAASQATSTSTPISSRINASESVHGLADVLREEVKSGITPQVQR